jgi:amino acid adenylation domain-containing protein
MVMRTSSLLESPPLEEEVFDPFAGPEILALVPLTESQAEIWTACVLGGDDASRAYNESVTLRLSGLLDAAALRRAWQAVVQRHEALRLVFSADGQYGCVLRELPTALITKDLSHMGAAEQRRQLAGLTSQEAQRVLDLQRGPLVRASLCRFGAEEHQLVLTVHHIVCDGWSLGIILQDLSQLYSAYCLGLPAALAEATPFRQYADQLLVAAGSPASQAVEQYWLKQYQGAVPQLALPTDRPRPATRTYQSARADYPLAPELVAGLKQVGRRAGSSLVTTLLAAFEVLLHQLTGQADLVVGLPAAGQPASGLPQLVGHCVNVLPLRTHLDTSLGFADYLKQRKTALLDAYDNQQLTFGSLLKKLRLSREAGRVPLVPVVFNIDLGLTNDVDFRGLRYELTSNPRAYESFELFLNASGSEADLVLEWSYNTALFDAATVGRWMASFEALIGQLIAQPAAPLHTLAPAEVAVVPLPEAYEALNATAQPYPAQQALHQLIAEQARATPQRLALKFQDTELSYQELNRQANQLANYFWHQGVQPGDVVAIAVERSPALVVSLLATMKCGAAYVPLDPSYPAERLGFMLTDSGAKFLLASAPAALVTTATVLSIKEALESAKHHSDQEPAAMVGSHELLYVLYTSGSTGKPKGVQVSHRNAVNFLWSMRQAPGIGPADRMLAITTISFDIAGLELFLPLVSGAAVVLADAFAAKDGAELLRLVADEHITLLQATPSSWRMMLDAGWQQPLPLTALSGGEALSRELAGRLLARTKAVWNMYGPTETTVWSTIKQVTQVEEEISVGRPIANTQVYVLDEHNRPADVGAVGELCIGGDGVARGYLNRPALTAEKFIANPFAEEPGALLYRTGDLARLLPSGELQCLGRLDQQVKIRGYRIEPSEIEHALISLAEVREAVVVAHPPQGGSSRLVAYVVPAAHLTQVPGKAHISRWQKALAAELPAYMVPSEIIIVDAIPLTLNGKVDRKALPQPAAPRALASAEPVPSRPRTAMEKLVATVWQEYLGGELPGIFDDFFHLGGHSLVAVRVMARLQQETGLRLPLATLFEHPTVEGLAAALQPDSELITWDSLVPIKPEGTKTPLYIVHGAGMNVLIYKMMSHYMDAEQPVYGLQARGLNGIDEPAESIEEMAADYVAAITAANPHGPYALAGYSFGGIIAFEMARQLLAAGRPVTFVGLLDTYAYQSDHYDPWLTKYFRRGVYFVKNVAYKLWLLSKRPKDIIGLKLGTWRRATLDRFKYTRAEQYELLNGHPLRMGVAQDIAHRNYRLAPQPVAVHLFRCTEHTYYLNDPEYLGWQEFAQGGVQLHDVPGNHFNLFAPPHDAACARVLQAALDKG